MAAGSLKCGSERRIHPSPDVDLGRVGPRITSSTRMGVCVGVCVCVCECVCLCKCVYENSSGIPVLIFVSMTGLT